MTIDELIAATGLTANDEIPIWDAEATGGPTKKITAQQLATAIVALASLVTSINGETGAVTLTAEDVNAKVTQTAVADPTASGNAVSFIDSISQNSQGVIVPTKKTVPNASTTAPGLMSVQDKANLDALESTVGELSDDVDGLTEAMADKADVIVDTASGAIASFPDGAAVAAKDIIIAIEPVQSGSGDPSPTNVRPISGWTGAKVTRTGKNLLPTATGSAETQNGVTFTPQQDGSLLVNGTATATTVYYLEKGIFRWNGVSDFWISGCPSGGNSDNGYSLRIGADVANYSVYDEGAGRKLTAFNGSITNKALSFEILVRSGTICNNLLFKPMLNEGLTAQSYVPYNPASAVIPISWQSEVGTVYGGTLDVTTGLLTVDRELITLDGIVNKITGAWENTQYGSALFFQTIGKRSLFRSTISNVLQYSGSGYPSMPVYSFPGTSGAEATCTIVLPTGTTKDQGNQWLQDMVSAGTPVQVTRLLETPQTYQLTPTEVTLLLGYNNVWADTGDSTVTYRADTKLYIQKINAPTDDDMIADAQIASGKYFIVGGNLYKSTTTIPAGDTITPGTNCILTNLADALNALNT